jgi:tetratricopeptide (TPR) repeat protein
VLILNICAQILFATMMPSTACAFTSPSDLLNSQEDSSLFRRYAGHQGSIRTARNLMNQRRFTESRQQLQPCLKAIPDHAEAHYLLAQMAYEERQFADALSHVQQAEYSHIKLDQMRRAELDAAEARDAAIDAALQTSISSLEAAGVDPKGCSGNMYTSRQHALNDQRQKLGRFEDETDMQGVPAELYLLKGNCLYRLKRLDEAKACYQQAIQRDRSAPTAWNNLIGLYLRAGDISSAKEWASLAAKSRIELRPELKKAVQERANPQHD